MLRVDIQKEAACHRQIASAETRAQIADGLAQNAIDAAKKADWWSRWGLLLGLGFGLLVGLPVGVVVGSVVK
jgi:hypothetical protein